MMKNIDIELNKFEDMLEQKKIDKKVFFAFKTLRVKIAKSLERLSKFVASDDEIEATTQFCQVQNAFGQMVNPFIPESVHLSPEQIALSLSREFRFWNQTTLSVAEHCVNMANVLQKGFPDRPELAQWAMFHELGEVTLGDTPTPIKDVVVGIRENENKLLARFANENNIVDTMPLEVHFLDKQMMITEALAYMPDNERWLKIGHDMGMDLFNTPLIPLESSVLRDVPLSVNDALINFSKKWIELRLPNTVSLSMMADGNINEAIKYSVDVNLGNKDAMSLDEYLDIDNKWDKLVQENAVDMKHCIVQND